MHKIDDINSILHAVNDINLKPKKKTSNISAPQNSTPKLIQDLIVPPEVDKIIREAEEYKNKKVLKSYQPDITENKNDKIKTKDRNKTFEVTQDQIIDDLHLKIKDLEKKLKNFQAKKEQTLNKNKLILKDEVVTSLQIQDLTIDILNEKIKKFKNTEDISRSQIIDLEQDKTLLLKKAEKFDESKDYKNIISDTKETLKTIYRQVAKQKKIFLDLKNYSIKTKRDFNFYKENYEKLIIENDDIKKKLSNTKQQVDAFEEIKKELAYTFENFNNVLSKNSIVKLNESFSKINSNPFNPLSINKKDK